MTNAPECQVCYREGRDIQFSLTPIRPWKFGEICVDCEALECTDDRGEDTCGGRIRYRTSLSPTGRSFTRCDTHWNARLDEQEAIDRRYPDSPLAPAGFDPSYAGERWDSDY